ncbi:MAG: AmmeMemoRadiSam system radical SAM enzyme [Candidatus Hydrogenedentota bacterium]
MQEARFYEKKQNSMVQCQLCPHNCLIKPGNTGVCGVRKNIDGVLYAMYYAIVSSVAMDPIEKKPLYHFYPGSDILSIGSYGCNFKCKFCQNYHISQNYERGETLSSLKLLEINKKHRSIGLSYTYNEPLINYEYIYDCSKLLKEHGFYNVLVTNGYINPEPLNELLPYIYSANIDLKSINNDFYKRLCSGTVEPVKQTIKTIFEKGALVEVTNLIIPGENDKDEEIDGIIDFIYSISPDLPLHFSKYFPRYKFNAPETPDDRLIYIYKRAKKKLHYVYTGNMYHQESSNTYCPDCNELLIERFGYNIKSYISANRCKKCGKEIYLKIK